MSKQEIISLRKSLHKHPELSGQEFETAERIKKFINKHNPTQLIDHIGGAGLAAIYKYSSKGPAVAIRCELDALPIEEANQFEHRSINKGISHKCGHDGHMAIVAGLIFWIKNQVFKKGKIILLFQPSEENGKGAEQVINDPKFEALQADYIFALHNIPGRKYNSILLMDKGFSAEVISFIVKLKGRSSHAAEPFRGNNPCIAAAALIEEFMELNRDEAEKENFAILTPVHINIGKPSYGISPAHGELHYTIRTWTSEQMDILKSKILRILKDRCTYLDFKYEIKWLQHFPASSNNLECNQHVRKAAQENGFEIIERPHPFKFGEDFGWFTKKYKTAMFGLGVGSDTHPLHSAQYDFKDELIETGMDMFKSIIKNILSEDETD